MVYEEEYLRIPSDVREIFDAYLDLGPTRNFVKLHKSLNNKGHTISYAQIKVLAEQYAFTTLVRAKDLEDFEAEKAAAKEEFARRARERIGRASQMMQVGANILDKVDLDTLSVAEARQLIGQARALIESGIKIERLELGEVSENYDPPKPIDAMTDEELDEYLSKLTDDK